MVGVCLPVEDAFSRVRAKAETSVNLRSREARWHGPCANLVSHTGIVRMPLAVDHKPSPGLHLVLCAARIQPYNIGNALTSLRGSSDSPHVMVLRHVTVLRVEGACAVVCLPSRGV